MRRLKHLTGFGFLAVLVLVVVGYGWHVVSASTPTITPVQSINIADYSSDPVKIDWPAYGQAAIGAEGYGVLASHGLVRPIPTASTAKIMTALCVLAKYPLEPDQAGPVLTLTQKDVNLYNQYYAEDGSLVKVAVGEKITEYQALEAMLLPSANNMADTLAIWAFGSLPAYDAYANQYAEQLGLKNTHFGVDASGFDPHTVSTASDLVLLGQAAMENPVLAQIVGEKTATVPVAGKVSNVNLLIGQDGIIGIKTGDNNQDLGAYLFAAKHQVSPTQSVIIIGAVMGAPSVWRAENDAYKMLLSSQNGFEERQAVQAGEVVGSYPVPWGSSVPAIAQNNLTVLAWKGKRTQSTISLDSITAPVGANQVVGEILVGSSSDTVTRDPVILKQPITAPELKWRLLHP